MSKVAFDRQELALDAVLGVVQLYLSSLHVVQLSLVCPIPMYVSNDPRIFEVNQSVVNKEATS